MMGFREAAKKMLVDSPLRGGGVRVVHLGIFFFFFFFSCLELNIYTGGEEGG